MDIPIENIYYLLSYSWNLLEEKNRVNVSTAGITNLVDLLAKVLINATRLILKKGIEKSYVETEDDIPGIKGKMLVSDTIKRNTLYRNSTFCRFDEFSSDVLMNRILVATLRKLLYTRSLDAGLRKDIRNILNMFPEISPVEINGSVFKSIRYNRNNKFYRFVINICELVNKSLLPAEQRGAWYFSDFTRDEVKMHRLFERFVYNFFRIEFRGAITVRRESIAWQFTFSDPLHETYIPGMMTDITLENKTGKIIIDTKYYHETLAERFEMKKVKSANLYQLFSYLLNQENGSEICRNATGVLLYPQVEEEYDLAYRYAGHNIHIKTINLNQRWDLIDTRLREISKL
jgi:5-methylcytosine-specific restriction enzyme subunit McrC